MVIILWKHHLSGCSGEKESSRKERWYITYPTTVLGHLVGVTLEPLSSEHVPKAEGQFYL